MELSSIKALITGGGTGIGLEMARQLRSKGAEVAICGRRRGKIEAMAADTGCVPLVGDVSKEADAKRIVDETVAAFGSFNVLINNAAFGRFAQLTDMELEDFEAVMATNVTGAMLMARESAKHFIAQDSGNIINIGSTSGLKGGPGATAYGASKFALRGMTEVWRSELRSNNIRVMLLNPSEVITEFSATAGYEQADNPNKLHAKDIAHAALAMLAMDDVGFTTELTVFATNPDG